MKIKIQKFEYLGNNTSFLDKMERIFHSYLKAIKLVKKRKIAGISLASIVRLLIALIRLFFYRVKPPNSGHAKTFYGYK